MIKVDGIFLLVKLIIVKMKLDFNGKMVGNIVINVNSYFIDFMVKIFKKLIEVWEEVF